MLRTLRGRSIVSHLLPLLLALPLAGIALIYGVQQQVLVPSLSQELVDQSQLIAELTREAPAVWTDPAQAAAFVARRHPVNARLKLLDAGGHLLASSDPRDANRLGTQLQVGLGQTQPGLPLVVKYFSQDNQDDIIAVVLPVTGPGTQVSGIVRLSYPLSVVNVRFLSLRYLVMAVLLASLAVGGLAGWVLAVAMQRPLGELRQAVDQLASGEHWQRLPEREPQEIGDVVRAFNALVDRLHTLEASRKQLLANLVHELGRPLGALQSAVQALGSGADRDAGLRHDLLAGMEDEVGRLTRLLDDLTGLHDQVLGSLELNRQPTALGEWLPAVLAPWQAAAERADLRWQSELAPELPTLNIDGDRLGQAVGNLLSNAIKYTPAGGAITVKAGVANDMFSIQVVDTGPGIAHDAQQRIFEPFQRGQPGQRFPQGMGLGLTIARDLTRAHGGRLEVDSAPGLGSRFNIWLPLQLSPA